MKIRRFGIAGIAGALVLGLAACSAQTPTDPTTPTQTAGGETAEPGEVVSLTFWGKTQGQAAQVELWNSQHPEIQVTFAEQGGDSDLLTAIQNGVKGGNAPDLTELPRTNAVSLLVEGATTDVAQWLNNDSGAFSQAAIDFVKVGDVAVGIPFAMNPTFNAVNTKTFERFALTPPTNWPEAIEQAKIMGAEGVKSFNFPGEDLSYLRDFATQFGAEWWTAEADGWRVGFTSPESLEAGELVQTIIDNELASNHTYIEWDALMQFFASGDLSQFTTSTWQLPVYEQNFAQSVGDWMLTPYPKQTADSELVSPSYYNLYGVTSTSEHPAEAVQFATWLATDPEAVGILADPVDGAAIFPVIADPEPYIDQLLPNEFLGDTRGDAADVVAEAAATARSMKEGPNQAAAFEEFAAWWGKAVVGQVKVSEALQHMQEWTIADLKSKNINVVES
ncbi:MAG TPA: extracellular solute-binding protein [Arachnia sp.]|nr:extracellular solute-binding protein [Arachnia sp.]HMT85648.1 extracellular solute-binding protein [Arachnia sp.]